MSSTGPVVYRVEGPVTFDNLIATREAGESAIGEAGDRAVIDLSGLENGNSVAVALLMAWLRAADKADKSIVYTGVPPELLSIIDLSGLTEVLPLETESASEVSG